MCSKKPAAGRGTYLISDMGSICRPRKIRSKPSPTLCMIIRSKGRDLIENNRLQGRDLDRLAAARVFAAQLVVKADPVVARLGKPRAILFIGTRGDRSFFGPAAPLDLILLRSPAFRTVDCGRHRFILLDIQVTFFHSKVLYDALAPGYSKNLI